MRRRVHVDPHLCEGHALCLETAPEVFDLDDSDVATSIGEFPEVLLDRVRAAVDACPRGAISIVEPDSPSITQPEFTTERTHRQ